MSSWTARVNRETKTKPTTKINIRKQNNSKAQNKTQNSSYARLSGQQLKLLGCSILSLAGTVGRASAGGIGNLLCDSQAQQGDTCLQS